MNSDTRPTVESIIEHLDSVQSRPGAFIGSNGDINATINFLNGFNLACRAIGYVYGLEIERQVLAENGWEQTARAVWHQMRKRGMNEDAIVKGLIALEILKWQRLASAITTEA